MIYREQSAEIIREPNIAQCSKANCKQSAQVNREINIAQCSKANCELSAQVNRHTNRKALVLQL